MLPAFSITTLYDERARETRDVPDARIRVPLVNRTRRYREFLRVYYVVIPLHASIIRKIEIERSAIASERTTKQCYQERSHRGIK